MPFRNIHDEYLYREMLYSCRNIFHDRDVFGKDHSHTLVRVVLAGRI